MVGDHEGCDAMIMLMDFLNWKNELDNDLDLFCVVGKGRKRKSRKGSEDRRKVKEMQIGENEQFAIGSIEKAT